MGILRTLVQLAPGFKTRRLYRDVTIRSVSSPLLVILTRIRIQSVHPLN